MIDRLALRVPQGTPMRREAQLCRDAALGQGPRLLRRAGHYARALDLRGCGLPVVLYESGNDSRNRDHKLDVLGVGAMGFSEIVSTIEKVFDIEPRRLELQRVDLAADVPDYRPEWFRQNARIRSKRHVADIGSRRRGAAPDMVGTIGSAKVETLYFGKRPDLIRIYDKVAERRMQYAKATRCARHRRALASLPSFEQIYGHPPTGIVLTRVEHEYGAGKVPPSLSTLGALGKAADFNPFTCIEFSPGSLPEPDPDAYRPSTYFTGMGLRQVVQRDGLQRTRTWINRSGGHASKLLKRYSDFLPGSEAPAPDLFGLYQESVARQLAA